MKTTTITKTNQLLSKFIVLNKLVKEEDHNDEENYKDGFITNYARKSIHEDIAELCEEAETRHYYFDNILIFDKNNDYNILKRKIKLAEEY
ncbi:hypothetical protein ACFL1H_07850, partial [Nanoarchaeota archaeon]